MSFFGHKHKDYMAVSNLSVKELEGIDSTQPKTIKTKSKMCN